MGGKPEGHSLLETPTYDIVIVLLTFVVFSVVFERLLHALKHFLKKHGKQGLLAAVDAMSTEIMLLGAISLALLALEENITSICMANNTNQEWTMLYRLRGCPCCLKDTKRITACFLQEHKCGPKACNCDDKNPTCLAQVANYASPTCDRGDEITYYQCGNRIGFRPAITRQALHQIHILVFIVALVHITCSIFILVLADLRVSEWKHWRQLEDEHITLVKQTLDEQEQKKICYIIQGRAFMHNKDGINVEVDPAIGMQIADMVIFDDADEESGHYKVDMHQSDSSASDGPSHRAPPARNRRPSGRNRRLRIKSNSSGLQPPPSFSFPEASMRPRPPAAEILICFLKQFTISIVSFEEFAIMRASFVLTHKLNAGFDFVDYVLNEMQHDFADVCGLGLGSWIHCCIFFLVAGTLGWPALWYCLIMIVLMLVFNTKLISIVRNVTRAGTSHRLSQNYFWFKRPWLMLSIIKLLVFLASFNLGTILFFLWDYGPKSCFFTNQLHLGIVGGSWWESIVASLIVLLGLGLETLPMYSICVQMGQKFKDEQRLKTVSQHFRSLPRPESSQVLSTSITKAGLDTVKRAISATASSTRPGAPRPAARIKGHRGGRWYGDTDSDTSDSSSEQESGSKMPRDSLGALQKSFSSARVAKLPTLGMPRKVLSFPNLPALADSSLATKPQGEREVGKGVFHDALTRTSGRIRSSSLGIQDSPSLARSMLSSVQSAAEDKMQLAALQKAPP